MAKVLKTILVVDDEPSVLRVVATVLQRAGYQTIAVSDPHRALSHATSGDAIDLLLTDLTMPGVDGVRLAQEFRLNSPGTKVLYMTGHPTRTAIEQGLAFYGDVINKPFRPCDLVERVERALVLRAAASAC